MGTRPLAFLAVAAALTSGCASDPTLPDEPPEDFHLIVEAWDATDPPCDLRIALDAAGSMRYEVRHRGEAPADRRGTSTAEPEALRAVWAAVVASGFLSRPDVIEGPGDGATRGTISFALRADGRDKTVLAPGRADPSLDALLDALVAAAPPRLLRPPGAD